MSKVNLYQRKKQECGYVHAMHKPDKADFYLIKQNVDEYLIAYFDGEFWENKVDRLICWREIPKSDIVAPF